jgi:hypothetical protein
VLWSTFHLASNVFTTEEQALLEFVGRGTNTGPLHMPTGDIPATGKPAEMRLCYAIKYPRLDSGGAWAFRAVGKPLADLPYAPLTNCSGEDRQVFRLQQRVIGELLILRDSNIPRCMSYPEFLEKLKESSFERHFEPLRAFLENVSPGDNCRWIRLEETRKALHDLMEYCQQVLKMPHETT